MDHPVCQVCRDRSSGQVHHIAGRIGTRLLDESQWLAVCQECHEKITANGKWARENGYRK